MRIGLLYIGFALALALWARRWERRPVRWGILAFLVSPVLAAVFLLIAGRGAHKVCPFCAEQIRAEAVVCKHCGRDVPMY